MLIYHPAYDAYHCVLRMLLVAEHVKNAEIDKARLLDFYLTFPGVLQKMRLPESLKSIRSQSKSVSNIYRDPVSTSVAFREMRHIQEAALNSIAASGLIDMKRYEAGFILRTDMPIRGEIRAKLDQFLSDNQPISSSILDGLSRLPLLGHDGLKHRSQLMEHRYDIN